MIRALGLVFLALWARPVFAQSEAQDLFLEANLVSTFYHELGHALIDTLDLPVLGREEDAADTLSVLLLDEIWEPDSALALAQNTALAWGLSAAQSDEDEPSFWDVHGHDLQRYYNTVCLWYGADPDQRGEFASDFDLPSARAETCAEEYQQAWGSWFAYLQDAVDAAPGQALRFSGKVEDRVAKIIAEEVRAVNALLALPVKIRVSLYDCGEANAFYDPGKKEIRICREYADWLGELAKDADL